MLTTIDQGVSLRGDQLAHVLSRLLPSLSIDLLEIGSYEGQSAVAWSWLINQHCIKGSVLCVDTWLPYFKDADLKVPNNHAMNSALANGKAFSNFQQNIKKAKSKVPIRFLRGRMSQVISNAHEFCNLFDLVYIDGSHYYADVVEDIRFAKELVRVGGLIVGDNLEKQLSDVPECLSLLDRDYVNRFYPGVTLAVGEAFNAVWAENGIWAVRRTETGFESLESN